MDKKNIHVVILAGGEGTRFAPVSTSDCPKQFLHITNQARTMIQETYDRVAEWVSPDKILVSTNAKYCHLVREQLPYVAEKNIIGEPLKKNTAPPIALITAYLAKRDPQAQVLFLPSDHYIHDKQRALSSFQEALSLSVLHQKLFVFGVPPTFPSSDYGYIEIEPPHQVKRFVEKPTQEKAKKYLESGNFFWNSGIFAWGAKSFLNEIKMHMPDIFSLLADMKIDPQGIDPKWLHSYFEKVPSVSIDYGLMEKTDNVGFVPFDVGWNDVGTWQGLKELVQNYKINVPDPIKPYL